jgi:hypothetical protein
VASLAASDTETAEIVPDRECRDARFDAARLPDRRNAEASLRRWVGAVRPGGSADRAGGHCLLALDKHQCGGCG